MANSFQTTSYVADVCLQYFINNISFIKSANRNYEGMFTKEKYAAGATVNFRLPNNFIPGTGPTITPQAMQDRIAPLTVNTQFQVGINFNSQELTLDLRRDQVIFDRYVKPIMINLADQCEQFVANTVYGSNFFTGTAGTLLSAINTVNNARGNLTQRGVPVDNRFLALNLPSSISMQNSMQNYFLRDVAEPVIRKGYIGELVQFETFETVHLPPHTSGIGAGGAATNGLIAAGQVNGAVSTGNTIAVKGLQNTTAGTFLAGDVIQIAGVNSVNAVNLQDTGFPAQFQIVSNAPTTDGSGNTTITVSPAIVTTGPYANVTTAIPNNAAISLAATHGMNVAYHQDALLVAMPPLRELDEAATRTAYATSEDKTISLRVTRGADITNDLNILRVDVIIGAAFNPQYATRLVA